jgi:transposase-like protein
MATSSAMLTRQDYSEVWDAFKQVLGDDDAEAMYRPLRDALKKLLEQTMVVEQNGHIQAQPFQHSLQRRNQRNGHYYRSLFTQFGFIAHLAVPRLRRGSFKTRVFKKYQRRWRMVDAFIRRIFLAGASTRETGQVLEDLLDGRVSAGTVSAVCKVLDAEVRQFHRRALSDDYRLLFLDGVVVKVRGAGKVVRKVILTAYGVKRDGQREIIGFWLQGSENRDHWAAFLADLYRRGLTGQGLELVTVDGSKGLRAALELVYPHVAVQRCWAHKLRNMANWLPVKYRSDCLSDARAIYQATTRTAALRAFRHWARIWRKRAPKAVACLEADLEELLTFLAVTADRTVRIKVRTTNVIERLFRELRKRIRPMCAFADSGSCERIVYSLFQTYNQNWKDKPLWK